MNNAYRTIWNKALGAFVATSELDTSRGKGKSGSAASICDARNGEPAQRSAVPLRGA
ncbi:ESPR domain-containing protein [Paraburkholderia sp.]|uniref:ESPR domain-containing protein n=1 Tax=Paraburkholderia sp. TaxID=1926495 RepID=UPI0039C90248